MKKNYFITLLLTFSVVVASLGQELLLNGGFENWDTDTAPTSWTKVENTTKETNENHHGSFSAKHVGGTKDLGQIIPGIIAGNSYTIVIWYKVIENDGTDARIWSYWKNASNNTFTDAATDGAIRGPENAYLDNNSGEWAKYEVTVTAPVGATQFYFELRTYSGATVYWDHLSFVNNTTASVKENTITGFASYPNPVSSGILNISSASSSAKSVAIFNLLGKKILTQSFSGTTKAIDVSAISKGVYLLKVTEGNNIATKKLVIR